MATKVLSNKYTYLKGKDAWRSNMQLTAFAADRIRSSIGPNGAYKMVTYNRGPEKIVKITRDAVPVLEELAIEYPTLMAFSEAAKLHRQQLGDGTKSFVVLTAELLKKADELTVKGVHPTVILAGYEAAAKKALEIINAKAQLPKNTETFLDTVDCGRGCLTANLQTMVKDALAVATENGKLDKTRIQIIRKPGASQPETRLIKGIVVKKQKLHLNMPDYVSDPKIAITSERVGCNRLEVKMPGNGPFHMKLDVNKPQDLIQCQIEEKQRKLEALKKLSQFGGNVLFSAQSIDEFSKSKLALGGVLAFESVDRKDLALICRATGARMVGSLSDLSSADVGVAQRIEIDKIGLEKTVTLICPDYVTFLIRGSHLQAVDEAELVLSNALTVLQTLNQSHKTVPGAGAIEAHIARQLKKFSLQFSGKEQLAVDAFAEAVLELPRSLAANNGILPDEAIADLGKWHAEGFGDYGICPDGRYGAVCLDVAEVKAAVVQRAFEVATLMLRVDEQVVGKEIPKVHKKQ